ncbi:MAG: DUF559 domain-containing protein [Candidatus Homeothermus sp.]|nr:DUF559 domain-containing protein [Candidatus Homeothermus sp.]
MAALYSFAFVEENMQQYNKNLKSNARRLRRDMTLQECRLWYDFLKKLPIPVYRQRMLGNYIVDFYIASKKLVIEIDGAQHQMAENRLADAERDKVLHDRGMTIKRYSNQDINRNFIAVCEDLLKTLGVTVDQMKK